MFVNVRWAIGVLVLVLALGFAAGRLILEPTGPSESIHQPRDSALTNDRTSTVPAELRVHEDRLDSRIEGVQHTVDELQGVTEKLLSHAGNDLGDLRAILSKFEETSNETKALHRAVVENTNKLDLLLEAIASDSNIRSTFIRTTELGIRNTPPDTSDFLSLKRGMTYFDVLGILGYPDTLAPIGAWRYKRDGDRWVRVMFRSGLVSAVSGVN